MKIQLSDNGSLIIDHNSADPHALAEISSNVFREVSRLESSYPNFRSWFFDNVATGLVDGSRSFIIELRYGKIAGVAILKNTPQEKKICTISISEEFRSKGLGFRLFEKSMLLLGTDKPLATVSDDRILEFEKIFNYLNYEFSAEYRGLYLPKKSEFSFNGILQ
jgi:hypothetical protein